MSTLNRRDFLRGGATLAGSLAAAGPMQALVARSAHAEGSTGIAANNGGYGPLGPVADKRDRIVRLSLPEGFNYRSFGYTGEPMVGELPTPGRQDGMATFPAGRGRIRIVRNHEVNGPVGAFGDPSTAYDRSAGGGTTTLELSPHAEQVTAWVSANGTQMNCAGGPTPWGSWLTCEETVNGPDVGPDFTGVPNTSLEQQHGYVFEVFSSWGPDENPRPVPIRSAGRFAHEAVAIDPMEGVLYLTEDNFGFPSGFYRYTPPVSPFSGGRMVDGGTLEMLKVVGSPGIELTTGQTPGVTYSVEWVPIPEPDTTFPPGTTNDEAIRFVGAQGFAQGAAKFSRLEGISYSQRRMYLVATQGGDAPNGPTAGYGSGFGQVWVYDLDDHTLTLLFESPSQDVLDLPDNLTVSPRSSVLLCEDGAVENYLRGVTPAGEIFTFARNSIEGREREEFAGATFSPNGQVLFVNIQASSGLTFAIWGPWEKGAL